MNLSTHMIQSKYLGKTAKQLISSNHLIKLLIE